MSKYSQEDIDRALLAFWLEGENGNRASELAGIPSATIRLWHKEHADRYAYLVDKHAPDLDKRLLRSLEAVIINAIDGTAEGVERTREHLRKGFIKDPSQATKNLATVAGIASDKWLIIQGRPNQIQGSQDASDHMRTLKAKYPWLVIDGEAEDITEAKQIEEAA